MYHQNLFRKMRAFSKSIWYRKNICARGEVSNVYLLTGLYDQSLYGLAGDIADNGLFRFVDAIDLYAELALVGIGPYHYAYCRFARAAYCFYQRIVHPVIQVN